MKKIMKRGRLEVLTIVIVLLLVLVGFSLFDYFNEKISKKEISGGVVNNLNQDKPLVPTGRVSPFTAIDKNGLVYSNIIPSGNINPSAGNKVLISTTPEGTRVFGKGSEEFNGYIVEFKEEPVLVKQKKLEEQAGIAKEIRQVLPENIRAQVGSYKQSLKQRQNDFINSIKQKDATLSVSIQSQVPRAMQRKPLKIMKQFTDVFNGLSIDASQDFIEEIKKNPEVKRIVPNYKVNITLMDSVPLINADDVWQLDVDGNRCSFTEKECLTGKGVTIGIIDTGVDYTHQDLGGCLGVSCKVVGGYDFVNNDNDPIDDHGHGTHVAATSAGNGVLKGVAPDASIYAYKVLDNGGSGYWDWVISGIERSSDPNQDGDYSDHLDVISLSLGGGGDPDDPISTAIDNVVENGVVAVIAAGNSGPGEQTIGSPGTARKAITVGATDKNDQIAYFSSRGPVIWTDINGQEQAIIKPDVTAPGVSICAAEYDSAWSDRKCLDDKHIAISGTSMATPHVSGAVALLLQKHPDWIPDEIKMALRNTAKDLGYDINTQGYGRIDALNAIQLTNKPPIAIIDTGGKKSSVIDIVGSAYGENFDHYTLYYGVGDTGAWNEIYISTTPIINGLLFSGFDTTKVNDGKTWVRLVVTGRYGDTIEDRNLLIIDNFKIKSIGETLNYIKGREDIKGEIDLENYEAYKVEYKTETEEKWNQICYETIKPVNDILCSIDVSSFGSGLYYFKLSVLKNGVWLEDESVKVAVVKEMLDNWPVELNGFSRGAINKVDLDNDGKDDLIVPHYNHCEGNWCSGTNLNIFQNDASFRIIDSLYKNGFSYQVSYDKMPSVYLDKLNNKNFIATSADWPGDVTGVFDDYGNLQYNWPLIGYNRDFVWPFVVIDSNNDNKEELFVNSLVYDPPSISLYGFDREGNLLENFPIQINKDNDMTDVFVLRGMGISKGNESINLGTLIGNYDYSDFPEYGYYNGMSDLRLYFDIYSTKGEHINRMPLFEVKNRLIQTYFAPIASGDLNNDGRTETVVSFGIFYLDTYFNNAYNPEAYVTYTYILDDQGNIITNIPLIKGYIVKRIAIADLGKDYLSVIALLGDTWATSYNEKVMAFDYSGNQFLDINLYNLNHWTSELLAGDVDGDTKSDIIIIDTPRWWDKISSKVEIYRNDGILSKEIEIPTFGEADLYNSFILGDFNKDNKVDLTIQSDFLMLEFKGYKTRAYILDLGGKYDSSKIDWPMILHDSQHTGCYDCNKLLGKNKFIIKNQNSENIGGFDEFGNIILKGTCQVQSTCIPTIDSFIFKNSNGDIVAYIDINGNLCIETGDCSSSTSCSATSNDEFIMQDETGKAVSKIDLINGDLCYTGRLIENGIP